MNLIYITGCPKCRPKKWKPVGESVGVYWCEKCRKQITQILERRTKNEHRRITTQVIRA